MTTDPEVEALPNRFLRCREVAHTWKVVSNWSRNTGSFGFVRVLRCTSCKCERRDIVDTHGQLISQPRKYPDGYLRRTKVVGERLTKTNYREESLRRAGVLEEEA